MGRQWHKSKQWLSTVWLDIFAAPQLAEQDLSQGQDSSPDSALPIT